MKSLDALLGCGVEDVSAEHLAAVLVPGEFFLTPKRAPVVPNMEDDAYEVYDVSTPAAESDRGGQDQYREESWELYAEEYEEAVADGFNGTFDEWLAERDEVDDDFDESFDADYGD